MFAFRKRLDGGYTIARRNANVADITPDSFRLLLQYLPTLKAELRRNPHALRPRASSRHCGARRRWSLDEVTPFEAVRVLDPAPRQAPLREARGCCRACSRRSRGMQVAESWGGMIDVTPDAVPVIDRVEALPGFFLATGFSGHGFGIGPGAGRLIADLVAGDAPVVDPAPFRFARFALSPSAPLPSVPPSAASPSAVPPSAAPPSAVPPSAVH